MDDPADIKRAEDFLHRLVSRGLAMEGTCTGEHGIGQTKMKYMVEEHSPGALDMMRTIKRALDPAGVMNPGKMI